MRAKNAPAHLLVNCPRCGYANSFGISRLDKTRTCTSCGVQFLINSRGKCILDGRRPRPMSQRFPAIGKRFERLRTWARPATEGLTAYWRALPAAIRRVVGIGGAVFFVLVLGSWLVVMWSEMDTQTDERAETLNVRAELVCQAVLLNDAGLLSGLTTRETNSAARRWLQRIRPAAWPETAAMARSASTDLKVLFKSVKNHQAAVFFEIRGDLEGRRSTSAADGSGPDIAGTLCWVLGADGRWYLDGDRTLQEVDQFRGTDTQ